MRRIFIILTILSLGFIAANLPACTPAPPTVIPGEDIGDDETVLDLSTEQLSFGAVGGEERVRVEGDVWSAEVDETWVTIGPKSGVIDGVIIVTVAKNATESSRSATLTVKNDAGSKSVTIEQAAPTGVEFDPASLELAAGGESVVVTVTSESSWEATCESDWLKVVRTDDLTGFTATARNNSGEERTAVVTVTNLRGPTTYEVSQRAHTELTLSTDILQFEATPTAPKTVTVTSESEWMVSSDEGWLTVSKNGTTGFTATASPNAGDNRSATVTVTNSAGSKTVGVSQVATTKPILDPGSLNLSALGGTVSVAVTNTTNWTISSGASWLTVTKTGNAGFTVTAGENDGADRSATISVTNVDGTTVMNVTQRSLHFGEGLSLTSVSYARGVQYDLILENDNYKVELIVCLNEPVSSSDPADRYIKFPEGQYAINNTQAYRSIFMMESNVSAKISGGVSGAPVAGFITLEGGIDNVLITLDVRLNSVSSGPEFKASYLGPLLMENPRYTGPR